MYNSIKVINLVMAMELHGYNFCKDNSIKSRNLQTKAIFEKLSKIELEHYEYLKKLLKKYKDGETVSEELNLPEDKGEIFFEKRKESENLAQNLEQSMIQDMNVLRMAYLIEEDFRDYYSMSKKVEDEQLREILSHFAGWEDNHAKIFKDEYDRLMDKYMNISWGG